MSETKDRSISMHIDASSNYYSLDVSKKETFSKLSPLPKPDFSSIEKKESNFTYKQKGSYKKPKSNVPESPIKSPNQKFFTPVKLGMKNLFAAANTNTCRKLSFGLGEDVKMSVENDRNFTETSKKVNTLLDRLDEEDHRNSELTSPNDKFSKKIKFNLKNSPSFFENLEKTSVEMSNEVSFKTKSGEDFSNVKFDEKIINSARISYYDYDDDEEMTDVTNNNTSKFDREFEVIRTLDAGAFGIVYKCIHKNDNSIYAVKKSIKNSSLYDYNMTNNLINDLKLFLRINIFSKFCVNYKDCWLEQERINNSIGNNHLYIIQDYCHHGDLLNYLEKLENKNFKFNEVFYWDLIFEMLCGVHFLHECGYVHLDIKPCNFLIDITGCVKIGDFGLSRKISEIKNSEDIYEGDCSYLAPEFFDDDSRVINSTKNINNKCDVFSLGLSILEILCRVELPQNGILWKKLRCINFEMPEDFLNNSNIKISGKMINLISDMLIYSPILRPSIISILQNPFYEEIHYRYNKHIQDKYIRCLDSVQYFKNEIIVDNDDNFYTKRSNSYQLFS